jgi:hypothetical protein
LIFKVLHSDHENVITGEATVSWYGRQKIEATVLSWETPKVPFEAFGMGCASLAFFAVMAVQQSKALLMLLQIYCESA